MPETPMASAFFGLRPLWRWIGGTILAVVLLLAVARGLLKPFIDAGEAIGAKLSSEGGTKESGLLVWSWVGRNWVKPGEPVRIWFKFFNPSTEDSMVESLDLYTPGFVAIGPDPKAFNLQGDGGKATKVPVAGVLVRGGKSERRWVDVRPTEWRGSFLLTTHIVWTRQAGRYQDTLVLGPIRKAFPWLEGVVQSIDSLLSILGTLAIPLTIALIGWSFQQRQQQFTQERQAWNTMLPISHTNNMKFYLPLINSIDMFVRRMKAYQQEEKVDPLQDATPKKREACFYLLSSARAMQEVQGVGSGFYLMDRDGEELITAYWSNTLGRMREQPEAYAEARLVIADMDVALTFANYLKNLQQSYDLRKRVLLIEGDFKAWADDEECVASLRLVSIFLRFEVNRIYKFWYGDEPRLDFEDCRTNLKKLPEDLKKRAEDYLKKLQGRGIKSPADP